ncbi:MAG: RidA family protein [Gammaproteobacteria bacterium]|nr:RidA family protein [Gammaproteobacteria bacterium]MBT5203259.1 RidA family protein [Gammaproteobacteria bacterium]MBT6246660.1 RidA family protein [Gammaproteobacteria bacterium]
MSTDSKVIDGRARPLGNYPHFKRAGDFIFVSGTSSRRQDNSHEGVEIDDAGNVTLDIRAQTHAVIRNIEATLVEAGSGLNDLVEISTFLSDMSYFKGYNAVYSEYFDHTGPARTTVAVAQLPHPNIIIEIKAVAFTKE